MRVDERWVWEGNTAEGQAVAVASLRTAEYAVLREIAICFERDATGDEMEVSVRGDEITQIGRVITSGVLTRLSPTDLRDSFLAVRSKEQAISFLQICGPFIDLQAGGKTQRISMADFRDWQGFTRRLLLGQPLGDHPSRLPAEIDTRLSHREKWEWFTDPRFEPRKGVPGLWFLCKTALETIAATIYTDRMLRRLTFKECPLCGKPFEVVTVGGNEKRYCSPDHSRKAAKARAGR